MLVTALKPEGIAAKQGNLAIAYCSGTLAAPRGKCSWQRVAFRMLCLKFRCSRDATSSTRATVAVHSRCGI